MKNQSTIYVTVNSKFLHPIFKQLDDEARPYDLRVSKASRGVVNIRLEVRQADTDHFAEISTPVPGGGATK